jgi:hypothetical protein
MGLIDNAGFRNTLFFKDSLKNEVLKRNPLDKNIKDPLPEPRALLGSGLKNRRRRIFQWILKDFLKFKHGRFSFVIFCCFFITKFHMKN